MKPTKMRNMMIYQATNHTRSKQLGANLSKDLQKKYGKRSVRVVEGDSIKIVRGEFKGVDGKVSKVSTQKNSVAIEGIKKEQTRGEKYDVYIHTSDLVVTSLNSDDRWRIARLEGKDPRKVPKPTPVKEEAKEESKEASKKEGAAEEKPKKEEVVEEKPEKEAPKETKKAEKPEKKENEE